MNYKLTIGWLYPELMSTYGDRGNIICFQKRCEWRAIKAHIKRLDVGFDHRLLATCNILFMGGAQDRQQKIVSRDFTIEKKNLLKEMVEDGTPGLYVCGAYQFLGKYYKEADGSIIPGLNILDIYTQNPGANYPRLIGNIAVRLCHPEPFDSAQDKLREGAEDSSSRSVGTQNDNLEKTLVGFENHGGRTYLGKNIKPLGRVIKGFGNNGKDKSEGAIYKNTFGTYLHGPILPKNPHFADLLIKLALKKKYQSSITLISLDDSLEWEAHNAIAKRLKINI